MKALKRFTLGILTPETIKTRFLLDSADVLARELVEADLLDGCDSLIVAHHMSELVARPHEKEHCFPLNSSTPHGQVPVESELHGYAKLIIRPMEGAPQ
ncbi:unnamed protein product [Hymenolepis diminuta]|uniref:non-specific serine/threonine protein kinase n=1 Tax=Hymenolepis diminuta TaxID=6216 RepID=A0A0R3SWG0_HYMDI|nr:unnamed protein product [Hymenolepis diminuta]